MSVKVLIDMNLSPDWVPVLQHHGWPAVHWSTVGDPRATDRTIMDWAVANGYIVFTHDLDFGTMLALTHATGPSVLQVRAEDVLPDHLEGVVIAALTQHDADLAAGALVVVDESKCRVRVLPI
jgi:predicted nuclease of predicted toxin-antitoxin system